MFEIASFGKTSTGKSSLLNALFLTDIFPEKKEIDHFNECILPFASQKIKVYDTPGIASHQLHRHNLLIAEDVASRVDLILFVCDDMLSHTEIQSLQRLIKAGKPVLIALNKMDTFDAYQKNQLIMEINERIHDWVAEHNIIACSANPDSTFVALDNEILVPDILPIKRRIQEIIKQESNTLRHLKKLSFFTEHALQSKNNIEKESVAICKDYSIAIAGCTVVAPLLSIDFIILIIGLTLLIAELADIRGHHIDAEDTVNMENWMEKEGMFSIAPFAGLLLISCFCYFIPVVGWVFNVLLMALGSYQISHLLGKAITLNFLSRTRKIVRIKQNLDQLSKHLKKRTISYIPAHYINNKINFFTGTHRLH